MPYTLNGLTQLARRKARGVPFKKNKIKCVVFPCPDPKCKLYVTHIDVEPRSKYGGVITLEPEELFMPKWAQDWIISHEISHLHEDARHGSVKLRDIESSLIENPNSKLYDSHALRLSYMEYRVKHYYELLHKARRYYMRQRK